MNVNNLLRIGARGMNRRRIGGTRLPVGNVQQAALLVTMMPMHKHNMRNNHTTRTCTTASKSNTSPRPLHHEWIVDGNIVKTTHDKSNKRTHTTGITNTNTAAARHGGRVVVFLHGLLGSGKNLRTLAKKFTKETGMSALLLDLRGHGQSNNNSNTPTAHTTSTTHTHEDDTEPALDQHEPPHSIYNCSMDVIHTVASLNLVGEDSPIGVVGHSFGGRTALSYHHTTLLQQFNQQQQLEEDDEDSQSTYSSNTGAVLPPEQCWILDSCPGKAHESVAGVIEAVSSINMPIGSKKELVEALMEKNISNAIASWMTTNLQRNRTRSGNGLGYEFMFDLDVVRGILNDFPEQDMFQQLRESIEFEIHPQNIGSGSGSGTGTGNKRTIHKVIAGRNSAWSSDILEELGAIRIQAMNSSGKNGHDLKVLTLDTGHWVHIDDLDGLIRAMTKEFQ
jgi:hypothetical protein